MCVCEGKPEPWPRESVEVAGPGSIRQPPRRGPTSARGNGTVDSHIHLWDIRHTRQPCGPERLMCGSDWPVALFNGDFDRVWQATVEVMTAAAPGALSLLLGDRARRIYRLEPRPGT